MSPAPASTGKGSYIKYVIGEMEQGVVNGTKAHKNCLYLLLIVEGMYLNSLLNGHVIYVSPQQGNWDRGAKTV